MDVAKECAKGGTKMKSEKFLESKKESLGGVSMCGTGRTARCNSQTLGIVYIF